MQKERKQLEELFRRYQHGLVTEDEKALIARWLIQLDLNEQLTIEQLEVKQALSNGELKNYFFPKTPPVKIIRFPVWIRSVAASVFVLLTVAGLFYFIRKNNDFIDNTQIAFQEVTTKAGEMKIITLSDGTKIIVNKNSWLKYPVYVSGKTREVFLTGEAFFEVAHNPAKPFKVHTSHLDVQVLGTSFNVQAFADDKDLAVSVSSGMVGVIPTKIEHKAFMLVSGDYLSYSPSSGKFSQSHLNAANVNAWQTGKFIFRNETLANITQQLERYYKVSFLFRNKSLLVKQINLKVKNQNIETVIKALSLSGDFRYKIEGSKITVW